ncbi:MAG TPA: LLM class F420-dependent oxidoreductase [Thermodesulfobacteriota bacterium]
MKIGLQIISFKFPEGSSVIADKLSEIAQTADDVGFSSIWVMDHLFQIDMEKFDMFVEDPMLESYSTLGFLAGKTKTARLGALVTGVVYRDPGLLIKAVTSLDILSGGRANLGIGAAWYEREARGLGFLFPPLKERFERLEETLQIAKQMWSGQTMAYDGKHYHLAEPLNNPQPITKPHPPIFIGGSGEKKTLRLIAKYGDACNLYGLAFGNTVEEMTHKLDVLNGHCEELGRPYNEIERTVIDSVKIAPDASNASHIINDCRVLAGIGIQHVIYSIQNVHEITPLEVFGRDVIPVVSQF